MSVSRWQRGLLGVGIVGLVVLAVVALSGFVTPSDVRVGEIDFGDVERFERGSVTTYVVDETGFDEALTGEVVGAVSSTSMSCPRMYAVVVHLVRFEDGSFVALSAKSPHMGEMVPWRPDFTFDGATGWFREPCHGDTYAMDGTRVFGPAPRGLSRYAVEVEEGRVIVDLDDLTESTR